MISAPIQRENISILPKPGCFGCGVCAAVCPTDCIAMVSDQEGFPYPDVDHQVCIECGKCIAACPGLNDLEGSRFFEAPIFYGGYSRDDGLRFLSSSGGFFSLIADRTLANDGVVYGARYDFEHMTVEHARVESQAGLPPLRKSKYVQSSTTHIFTQVKQDLILDKSVLFTGTPCQVAGLHLYLGQEHPNLVTCDIICHGVPSPGLFHSHFSAIARGHHGSPITDIDFRTKEKGWSGPLQLFLKIDFSDDSRLVYSILDAYYALFLANLSLRPCCYHCKYATTQRNSDLTLGDFWGVKKHYPDLFDGKGTALILVNTAKGERILSSISSSAHLTQITTVKPFPPNLARPTPRPKYRDRFFTQINPATWRPNQRWYHLMALLIIAKDKALGALKSQ